MWTRYGHSSSEIHGKAVMSNTSSNISDKDTPSAALDQEGRRWLLRTMQRIRRFEEKISDLLLERDAADRAHRESPESHPPYPEERRLRTPCHLYIGQEAIAAGVFHCLETEDSVWSTHRAHGHYIAKGGGIVPAMAEIFCRTTGCSRGHGGSMHLCAPEVGFMGSSAIVAGTVPLGVGAATAEHVRGGHGVSVIFHGDAVPEEGVFHEALNWAVLHSLPVVFCCEDNMYSTHLHMKYRRRNQDLSQLVSPYGIRVEKVDGNDVREVHDAATRAVDQARAGGGPTFLHCMTYRWRGHVGPYDNLEVGLRSPEELGKWLDRCPIELEKRRQMSSGALTEDEFKRLCDDVTSEIDGAAISAIESPRPPSDSILDAVFREGK